MANLAPIIIDFATDMSILNSLTTKGLSVDEIPLMCHNSKCHELCPPYHLIQFNCNVVRLCQNCWDHNYRVCCVSQKIYHMDELDPLWAIPHTKTTNDSDNADVDDIDIDNYLNLLNSDENKEYYYVCKEMNHGQFSNLSIAKAVMNGENLFTYLESLGLVDSYPPIRISPDCETELINYLRTIPEGDGDEIVDDGDDNGN
jgi:hypothetical protein